MVQGDPTVQSDVLLTERTGNVLVLTLNRPEVRNALNPELKDRLTQEMREADALNGPALAGGFELVLACDLIVAAEEAKVGLPEVKRGLFAAGGGTTLSARIPLAVALEFGLTGEFMSAQRAREIGLFTGK